MSMFAIQRDARKKPIDREVVKATFLLTLLSTVTSVVGTALAIAAWHGFDMSATRPIGITFGEALTIAAVMPAIIAPPIVRRLLVTMRDLEAARAKLDEIARTDPLTGCLNRRALEERVVGEMAYAQRVGRPLALLVVDLDRFKSINDRHGHAAGDAVLVAVARVLLAALRPSDILARYGGEEFCVLLRDTGEAEARLVGERLRAALRAMSVGHGGDSIRVSASFGGAVLDPSRGEKWDGLFARADAALFHAKQAGRDRVEVGA
jgi:diguanylate cyclase (GGDEF)-like protein